MTDVVFALTVVLEKDVRTDDLEAITNAIKMIRGVLNVTEHVSDISSFMAEERARHELGEKLWNVLYPKSA